MTIKSGLGREDFRADPRTLLRALLDNGNLELPITIEHAVTVDRLPDIHRDPFERILIAQATVEEVLLLTVDDVVARLTAPPLGSMRAREPPGKGAAS